MNFVSQVSETIPQASLKLRLHKHLRRTTPGRSVTTMHASDVTKDAFCPRRHCMKGCLGHKQADEQMTLSSELTFSIGRAVQDQLVAWYADAGVAVGDWKCVGCGKMHTFCKRPGACLKCGAKRFDAVEVRFVSAVNGISGGFDMLADIGEPKLRLVEIKTMKPEEWEKLLMPLAEHRVRTNLYLRLVGESNHPMKDHIDTTKATVLYASKGGYGKADATLAKYGMFDKFSPLKEFVIPYDPSLTDHVAALAQQVQDFRRGYAGMPQRLPACIDVMSKRAQDCDTRVACFGQMFPPGASNPNPLEVGL